MMFKHRLDRILDFFFESYQSNFKGKSNEQAYANRNSILEKFVGEEIVIAGKYEDNALSGGLMIILRAAIVADDLVIPLHHIHIRKNDIRGEVASDGATVAIRGTVTPYQRLTGQNEGSTGYTLSNPLNVTSDIDLEPYLQASHKGQVNAAYVNQNLVNREEVLAKTKEYKKHGALDHRRNLAVRIVKKSIYNKNLDQPLDKNVQESINYIKQTFQLDLRGQNERYAYFQIFDANIDGLLIDIEDLTETYLYNNKILSLDDVDPYFLFASASKNIISLQEAIKMVFGKTIDNPANKFIARTYNGKELATGGFNTCAIKVREAGGLEKAYISPIEITHEELLDQPSEAA